MTITASKTTQKISTDLTFQQVFDLFPDKARDLAQIMMKAGLHCVGCGAANWETLSQGMKGHGMSDDVIDSIVLELNACVSEYNPTAGITISNPARAKVNSLLAQDNREKWGLYFGLKSGGCQGQKYDFFIAEYAKDDETTIDADGLPIFIPNADLDKLMNSVINYTEGAEGFSVENKNVVGRCGCGSSVSF